MKCPSVVGDLVSLFIVPVDDEEEGPVLRKVRIIVCQLKWFPGLLDVGDKTSDLLCLVYMNDVFIGQLGAISRAILFV